MQRRAKKDGNRIDWPSEVLSILFHLHLRNFCAIHYFKKRSLISRINSKRVYQSGRKENGEEIYCWK